MNFGISKRTLWGLLVTLCFLIVVDFGLANPLQETQSENPTATQQDSTGQTTPVSELDAVAAKQQEVTTQAETFIGLITLGGIIAYVIVGVFIVGVVFLFWNAIELFLDYRNSKELMTLKFSEISLDQLKNSLENRQESHLRGLLQHIILFYEAGDSATEIHEELVGHINVKTESYETYRNWLGFLADAAGGLGLLGTVWGIFRTFFGGALDPDKILNGMGIALITTLVGVGVSLIINFGGTKLFGTFNKRMKDIAEKADELRLHLLGLDSQKAHKRISKSSHFVPGGENTTVAATNGNAPEVDFGEFLQDLKTTIADSIGTRTVENVSTKTKRSTAVDVVRDAPGFVFEIDDSLPATISSGATLQKALKLTLLDQAGLPIQKAKVFFSAEGAVHFDNKKNKIDRPTDKKGEIAVNIHAEEKTGHGEIRFWLENYMDDAEIVEFNVTASVPEKIAIDGGDDQIGFVGQALSQPLQVVVRDRFDNLVENAEIAFDAVDGDGVINGLQKQCIIRTDKNGYAEATYTLGRKTHFHTINAKIKNGKGDSVVFHVLGKAKNA